MSTLMYLAVGFLVIAIFFGLIVFMQLACDRPSFKPAAWIHGLCALTGLGLIILYQVMHPDSGPLISVIILSLAALGGLTLFVSDLQKKSVSKLILFLHPLLALIGFGFLIAYVVF